MFSDKDTDHFMVKVLFIIWLISFFLPLFWTNETYMYIQSNEFYAIQISFPMSGKVFGIVHRYPPKYF